MTLQAIVFVGIGSLAEYADIDRQAWNSAFRARGLRWHWSWDAYAELMRPGGDRHLAGRYAEFLGEDVDAGMLDEAHIRGFAARMCGEIPLRPGVASVLNWAMRGRLSLALVSRGAPGVVHPLLAATARARAGIEFDTIISREAGARLAPYPDSVTLALDRLGLAADRAIAIADTPASAAAALDAGLTTIGYPGLLAEEQSFPEGSVVVQSLGPGTVADSFGGPAQTAAE